MKIGKNSINQKNILIVRLGAMGDIIHVIPAVKNVREALPTSKITWLVEDNIKDLVEMVPEVMKCLSSPGSDGNHGYCVRNGIFNSFQKCLPFLNN